MAIETKAFETISILTVVTGRVLTTGGIGGVYEVLNWMTGESLYTHQLPRVCREAVPIIVAAHPELQSAIDEAGRCNEETYQYWRDLWLDRYGPEMTVPKFSEDGHERIDPISELAEYVHPDKIITVQL